MATQADHPKLLCEFMPSYAATLLVGSRAALLINIIVNFGREAVEAQLVVFLNSVSGGKTPYRGPPTQENERNWEELYHRERLLTAAVFFLHFLTRHCFWSNSSF